MAMLYASVGFGGGSSYIAILLLAGLAIEEVRLIALICNIIVVLGACINYCRADLIPWKKILPIVLLSIPFAFLGGMIQLDGPIYKLLAGITLVIAALLMIKPVKENQIPLKNISMLERSTIGSGIGFISGLIGIGGGIFLSPFLNILRWQTSKVISVTASVFILFNSVAGIAGQLTNPISINIQQILTLGLAVAIGGQIGNYLNIKLLSPRVIKLLTAILVCVVGVRFILTNT
tara:strand:- start:1006 stop:1707 length:702 start_codon:yes stop_codon:yes gene_type:complete